MAAGKIGRALCMGAPPLLVLLSSLQASAQDAPKPRRDRWEIGFIADALFLSRFHNVKEAGRAQYEFKWPAVLVGGRGGYYPQKFLGFEAEALFGYGQVGKRTSREPDTFRRPDELKPPWFVPLRLHVVGQVPVSRFVPFVLLGGGILNAKSTEMGKDTDVLFDLGIGAKYFATKHVVPRLDLRLDMTQREGGGLSEGVALHTEIILGVSANFGVH
ncbi:MAG TPA: outer membrane beta-barrel protein [Polyangiaceae bacterium]|nr:outer membrane beta-barrel protein [Polyangiaceae bacterium]